MMPPVIVDFVFSALVAGLGAALGWVLRGSRSQAARSSREDHRHVQEVLSRLHDLTARVAADVGEHSSRVEEINEELTSTDMADTDAVVSAVGKLVEANNRMQHQLASAEERLQEQARQIESVVTEARTDVLTGLANRRALDDATARCMAEFQRSGKTFSTVMVDIDHFKKFNDVHGHQTGDEVLRRVAGILRQNTRQGAMAARYGGEEFAIILPGAAVTDAVAYAERIRKAIDSARFLGSELHVTVSAGAAQLIAGEDVAAMIKRADASLYASKGAGRNCTHWHDGARSWPVAQQLASGESSGAKCESPAAKSPPAPEPRPAAAATTADSTHGSDEPAGGLCDGKTFCTMLGKRLAEWRRGGLPPSVLLIHIDRYQSVVAEHGHPAGNRVLRATMQFLRAAIRDMDLVAQYEDTTYALLLPGAGLGNAIGVAERLRRAIGRYALPLGQDPQGGTYRVQFTVSVGGAEASGGDDTPRLLSRAQEALDSAIQSGGDTSYFHNGQWSETADAALVKVKSS